MKPAAKPVWQTPRITIHCVGTEINAYASAAVKKS
jgi:coenzyme PQQ precursor peptide PqqA